MSTGSPSTSAEFNAREQRLLADVLQVLEGVAGPFRIYTIPMLSDGVFVGQHRDIKPHGMGLDGPLYPAVPEGAVTCGHQVPLAVAERAVEILNARDAQ